MIITGTNLTGATSVKFGSTATAAVAVNSPTQITATAPAKAAGSVDVTVTTPGDLGRQRPGRPVHLHRAGRSLGDRRVAPTSGSTTGGTSVTITGTNFTGATGVTFGATPAHVHGEQPHPDHRHRPGGCGGQRRRHRHHDTGHERHVGCRCVHATSRPRRAPTGASASGYDLVGADGGVFVFPQGQAGGFYGSLPGLGVQVDDIVGMVPSRRRPGLLPGGLRRRGVRLRRRPVRGLAARARGLGARHHGHRADARRRGGTSWSAADGGVFAFGDAPFLGSLPGEGIHRLRRRRHRGHAPDDRLLGGDRPRARVFAFGDRRAFWAASAPPPRRWRGSAPPPTAAGTGS